MTSGGGTTWGLVGPAARTMAQPVHPGGPGGRGSAIGGRGRRAAKSSPGPSGGGARGSGTRKRRRAVELPSTSPHTQYEPEGAPTRPSHSLGTRAPLIPRVDRGLYRRYRPTS